jgi:hypothetical protein
VQTLSGRHINVGLDGAIEMSAEDDAQYHICDGWTILAEWTWGLTGMSPHQSPVCTARRWYRRFM